MDPNVLNYTSCQFIRFPSYHLTEFKGIAMDLSKTGNSRSNLQKLGTFGNLKVLPFQNRHRLLHKVIFGDFISILAKKP